ncbi:MAG: PorV/PorQ family protein [Bacteroidia bacterium]|nr:PorV/PorQ family protein [Bacteroidia bacterium]
MRKISIKLRIIIALAAFVIPYATFAGNEQRAGSAGASELLVNPWAGSTGWADANMATVRGLEAIYSNVAGIAFTKRTELIFARSSWLTGSGLNFNSFGLTQKVGESGVLALWGVTLDAGDIDVRTVESPEGGIGKFNPKYTNIAIAYSKEFSNSIYGGMAVKIVTGGISDLSTSSVAIDAGIQYVTGVGKDKAGNRRMDNLRFGISMKNVGPTMMYKGDGLSFRGTVPSGVSMTLEQRSAEFELPSLIKIGFSLHFNLTPKVDTIAKKVKSDNKLVVAGTFTSNSFTRDQYHLGLEYNWREIVFARCGYVYEKDVFKSADRATAFTGPTAGVSVQLPMNKEKGSTVSIDYSYRDTNPFSGIHSIGVKVTL